MTTIYHNPRCSKSRATLDLLQANGVDPEVILYLETPPSADELRDILGKLGKSAHDLLRGGEAVAKELDAAAQDEVTLIQTMVANPILIERPIVVKGSRAVVGRPPENVLSLL
ncbi:MAG: arsenate reductase (glutaredoxin) [Pseudomonadales bacterium]|nr:arsenate reductase (glutaredoxin) [Pseudomonadales bacterium]